MGADEQVVMDKGRHPEGAPGMGEGRSMPAMSTRAGDKTAVAPPASG